MNKVIKIIITTINNIQYILKMDQKKIYDLEAFNLSETSILHNIYIGKVQKIDTSLQAAFVEFSKGKIGFLPLNDGRKNYPELKGGDEILVQISKEAIKTKAPLLTTNITLSGKYCVAQYTFEPETYKYSKKINPTRKMNLAEYLEQTIKKPNFNYIIRSSCSNLSDLGKLLQEITYYETLLSTINEKKNTRVCFSCLYENQILVDAINTMQQIDNTSYEIVTDDVIVYKNLLDYNDCLNISLYNDATYSLALLYGIIPKLSELLKPRIWLKSGAYLIIEPTEALTVIDVNTGKIKATKSNKDIIFDVNKEAALEIASQIKLRNISGIIIVDFINMNSASLDKELIKIMREYVETDKILTNVIDITSLGLMQITRKKETKSLMQMIGEHKP